MEAIISLFLLQSAGLLAYKLLSKLSSNSVESKNIEQYIFFFLTNCLVACLFFFITGGFQVHINLPTFYYSLAFSGAVFLNLISALLVYRFASVAMVNIVSCGSVAALSPLVGWLLFNEAIYPMTWLRVAVILIAVTFLYIDLKVQDRRAQSEKSKRTQWLPLLLLLFTTVLGLLGTSVVNKYFMLDATVTNESSLCFLTNVVLIAGASAILMIRAIFAPQKVQQAFKALSIKNILLWSGNVVSGNIGTLVGFWLLLRMDIAVYTPVYSALGILLSTVTSIILKEKLTIYSYIATALACIAVIL